MLTIGFIKVLNNFKDPNCLITDFRERRLAQAYVKAVAKDPKTLVDLISPDGEMYIFTTNNIDKKEAALYLYS